MLDRPPNNGKHDSKTIHRRDSQIEKKDRRKNSQDLLESGHLIRVINISKCSRMVFTGGDLPAIVMLNYPNLTVRIEADNIQGKCR